MSDGYKSIRSGLWVLAIHSAPVFSGIKTVDYLLSGINLELDAG